MVSKYKLNTDSSILGSGPCCITRLQKSAKVVLVEQGRGMSVHSIPYCCLLSVIKQKLAVRQKYFRDAHGTFKLQSHSDLRRNKEASGGAAAIAFCKTAILKRYCRTNLKKLGMLLRSGVLLFHVNLQIC